MFNRSEVRTILSILVVCVIAFYTAPLWGAGGLITTAISFYVLLGALTYVAIAASTFAVNYVIGKVRNRTVGGGTQRRRPEHEASQQVSASENG